MHSDEELASFIRASFRSIWALELLLLIKRDRRVWSHRELVSVLRASDLVVSKALDSLVAGGIASLDERGVLYMPVSQQVAMLVDQTERVYSKMPDTVRRLIVAAQTSNLAAFADAFRLRKD